MNLTDEFLSLIQNKQSIPEELSIKLDKLLRTATGLTKPLKFPLRKLQIASLLQFIRRGRDIFCVLPTSYGKTMIAMLAATWMWNIHHKKTIYIGIYKALTAEIAQTMNEFGIQTIIDDGDHRKQTMEYETLSWQVCCLTPEKFESVISNNDKRITLMQDVGMIITDEAQNIGDKDRGDKMENFLVCCRYLYPQMRYVYLSATIGNPESICDWLKVSLIHATIEDRPVELNTRVYPYREVTWANGFVDAKKTFEVKFEILLHYIKTNPLLNFLVFCTSRERVKQIQYKLKSLHYSVEFHHAGLEYLKRVEVEKKFRSKEIQILVSTSTTAAGVNLPADMVVIFDIEQYTGLEGKEILPANMIQQMMGRAGRPGLSKHGYAIILTPERIRNEVQHKTTHADPVQSQFTYRFYDKILKWIAGRIVIDKLDMEEITKLTLAKISENDTKFAMFWLHKFQFIETMDETDEFLIRELGLRTTKMYIMPETVVEWQARMDSYDLTKPWSYKQLFTAVLQVDELLDGISIREEEMDYIRIINKELPYCKFENPGNQCLKCDLQFTCFEPYFSNNCKYTPKIYTNTDALKKVYGLLFHKDIVPRYYKAEVRNGITYYKGAPIITEGDKYNLTTNCVRLLAGAAMIFQEFTDFAKQCNTLAKLITAGYINEDLLELLSLRQVGPVKAMALCEYGVTTKAQFLAMLPEEAASVMEVSLKVATKIQNLNRATIDLDQAIEDLFLEEESSLLDFD